VGLIAMDTNAACVTVRVADALIEPDEIPIDVVPVPKVLARPIVPAASLIVATVGTEEVQEPLCVRSCVLPSV
jgi:hypothetical protein